MLFEVKTAGIYATKSAKFKFVLEAFDFELATAKAVQMLNKIRNEYTDSSILSMNTLSNVQPYKINAQSDELFYFNVTGSYINEDGKTITEKYLTQAEGYKEAGAIISDFVDHLTINSVSDAKITEYVFSENDSFTFLKKDEEESEELED